MLETRLRYLTDKDDNERKILRNVFTEGDSSYRSGDLMRSDRDAKGYFVDRIGDTYARRVRKVSFHWKGENVSAAEVAAILRTSNTVSRAKETTSNRT